jgi:hypothetical protein
MKDRGLLAITGSFHVLAGRVVASLRFIEYSFTARLSTSTLRTCADEGRVCCWLLLLRMQEGSW